jgi:multiple sugar transport system substrate-binding protein
MGPPTAPGQKAFNNALAKAFHAATGATLKYDYNITSTANELSTIAEVATTTSGPDMVQLGDTITAAGYAAGGFAIMTPKDLAAIGGTGQFWPRIFGDAGPNASHIIGTPDFTNPTMLVYNTKLFAQAHISGPPTTWTQFVNDALKINDPSHGIYGTDFFPNDTQEYKALWYLASDYARGAFTKNPFNAKVSQAELDNSAYKKATEFWFDLATKWHVVPPNSAVNTQADFAQQFATGKIGEEVASSASYQTTYETGAIGKNFRFAPLPTVPYGETGSGTNLPESMLLYEDTDVAKYAPMPLALAFLKIMVSKKMQVLQYRLTGNLPVTVAAAKAVQPSDPTLLTPEIYAQEHAYPVPFTPAWATYQTAIGTATIDAGSHLATKGSLSTSTLFSLLTQANATVQKQL